MSLLVPTLAFFLIKLHTFLPWLRALDKYFAKTCNELNTPLSLEKEHPFWFHRIHIPKPVGFSVVFSYSPLFFALSGREQYIERGIQESAALQTCCVFLSEVACGAGRKELWIWRERFGRGCSSWRGGVMFPLFQKRIPSFRSYACFLSTENKPLLRLSSENLKIEGGRKALIT